MPFPVTCQCGQRFMAQDHLSGQQVPCPACGSSLLIRNPAVPRATPHTFKVTCSCGRNYQPGPELAGCTVRCTACGNVLQIPALPGTTPMYQQPLPTLPQRTVFPSTMKRPTRPARATATRTSEASEQLTLRIVIGLAITVCLCAIVGGIGFGVVLPMVRQLADRGDDGSVPESVSDTEASDAVSDGVTLTRASDDAATGERSDAPVNTANNVNGPSFAESSNPFETPGDEGTADASNGETTAYASASEETAVAPGSDSDSSNVARSGVAVPGAALQGDGKSLGLVGSLDAWHAQPNRDLKAIRKVGGDNLAVYAHYSWMTELLPYLGHQKTYDKFQFSKSWLDDDNLQLSGEIIREFQNPSDRRERWKGYPFENMALTHFVGMAGIEDRRNVVAAKLPRSDSRAGIFGYDDVAKRDEITDGESNTIMLIGSGKLASPWVAGGGATVRGAREPYFDELTGFGSQGGARQGAISVMADGSVRFVSSDIDPAAFRALSTIHGNENVDVSRWLSETQLTK